MVSAMNASRGIGWAELTARLTLLPQLGGDVGRDQFDHLDACSLELMPKRHRERVDGGLGRTVDGEAGQRDEGKSRRDVYERRTWMLSQVWQECRRHPDDAQKVGVDLVEDSLFVEWLTRGEVVMLLDPGVVEDAIQVGELLSHFPCNVTDRAGVRHIKGEIPHPGVRLANRLQGGFPSAADDDPVAEFVERLGQAPPMPELAPVMKTVLECILMRWSPALLAA